MIGRKVLRWLVWLGPAVATMLIFSAVAVADLHIQGYQDRLHDPYYVGANKDFIGADYSWSGVGRIEDPSGGTTNWKTLAMISDNYFITADHNKPYRANDPGAAPKVRFYRTADPNGEFWESEIATVGTSYVGERIGSTDLYVGKLAKTPPSWVMRYPLAKRHQATNYLSYTDSDLFIFGQDSPRSFTSLRVGRNEIESVDIAGNYDFDYDVVNGLGVDEAETQGGDSGSPSFFTSGTVPVLAGVHTRVNFDTGVSMNLAAIMSAVGEPVSLSTGLIGDLNGNFRVDADDFLGFLKNYGKQNNPRYHEGDVVVDGVIDGKDFVAFLQNFNQSLYAPTDFDRDGDVDGVDLTRIGDNWMRSVAVPFTAGDANGDGFVNLADVNVFDDNQYRAFFGPLYPPLSPVSGDLTGNGVVDGFDLSIVTTNLNKVVSPGTNGDADGNGLVNSLDVAFVSTRLGSSFGDVNGDHAVGPLDFSVLASSWNKKVTGGRLAGDLNGDGWVTTHDAQMLFGWWGQQGGEFPGMLVPEPASVVLFAWLLFVPTMRLRHKR